MAIAQKNHIVAFDLKPGRVIGGKYAIETKLGGGWEGEVYQPFPLINRSILELWSTL